MSESDPADSARPADDASAKAAEAEPPAAPPPAAASPARRGGAGWAMRIVAGFILLSAAAAGGGLVTVYWAQISGQAPNVATDGRIHALEARLDQLSKAPAATPAAANTDKLVRDLAALRARVDTNESKIATLEIAPPQAAEGGAAFKAASDKNTSDIAALTARLDTLEQAQAEARAQTPNPVLTGKIDDNAKALAALQSDLGTQAKAHDDALGKLDTRIASLEKTAPPADLAERLDSFALKTGVAALDTRVRRLEDEDAAGLMRRAARVLALADLVRATESEQPFANELAALNALMPGAPELADLSRYAKKGAPSLERLTAQFHQSIDSALTAERTAHARNWAERVWFDVVTLVSVRRVGNVSGTDTEARLARAEYALKHADLAAAVKEVNALDAPAKAALSSWLAGAKARLAVDRDAHALTAKVVMGLGADKSASDTASGPHE